MNEEVIKKLLDKIEVLDASDLSNLVKLLWRQREFLKTIFNLIKDSVVVINTKGEIIYCNQSARELLGITQLKTKNVLWKYIPEFIVFSDQNLFSDVKNNISFSKEIKISYPHRSILNITISYNCNSDDDTDKMLVLRIVDVTQEKELSEKFISEEKTSSVMLLASGIAHEIGNPLNAIALRLELMKRQLKTIESKNLLEKPKLHTSVDICLDEISRLDGIIKNFLQAIRPQRPKMSEIFLHQVIKRSLDLMESEFKSLNINVINNVKQTPPILGDTNQLQQVFFNILKNACEAISSDGTIIIESAVSDNDVIITFTDNGLGISCEIFDKIFAPYFSTKPSGNGLGMMIVKRILNDHEATIDIASAENIGTKITIRFPRKNKQVPLLYSGKQ